MLISGALLGEQDEGDGRGERGRGRGEVRGVEG